MNNELERRAPTHDKTTANYSADEAAIRQLVRDTQDGQNTKVGELFASAFAQEHDHETSLVGNPYGAPVPTLGTDEVRAAHEQLRGRGVRFRGEPRIERKRYPWGR